MSNSYFQFKKFTVWHDRCAMKVGTDGVLLGAWAPITNRKRILDVGTGTGLISLLLAQRSSETIITALEIDIEAANQAAENVASSPWKERIKVICCDFCHYETTQRFDLIVSNPPYFIDSLQCPDSQRNTARHAGNLNYDALFRKSAQLLLPNGIIAIVIPNEIERHVMDISGVHGFFRYTCARVFSKPGKKCRRLLMTFGRDPFHPYREEQLYIQQENGSYTDKYRALTGDFYLKM